MDFSQTLMSCVIRRFDSGQSQQTSAEQNPLLDHISHFTWILGSHSLISLDYKNWPVFTLAWKSRLQVAHYKGIWPDLHSALHMLASQCLYVYMCMCEILGHRQLRTTSFTSCFSADSCFHLSFSPFLPCLCLLLPEVLLRR